MKRTWRSVTALLVSLCLLVSLLAGLPVLAAEAISQPEKTSNLGDHQYTYDRWANPIKSYLVANSDGTLTRVEYTGAAVTAETYDSNFNFLSGQRIAMELPIFGGFYSGSNYNFLVFGQENPAEDANTEVIRVVCYTKAWQRVDAAGLYGANTTIPFDAGSVRFAEYGGYLYIRTAHEMYQSSDGLNHQANVMLNVRIADMTITDSQYAVSNSSRGYVSHSFNQFVLVDGTSLIALDHGDAYPRSVAIFKYAAPAGQDSFMQGNLVQTENGYYTYVYCEKLDVLPIGGSIGHNDTGVALGGFECSESAYLVAGNTTAQGEAYDPYGQRNIFVAAVDKSFTASGITVRKLTSYTSGVEVSNPQFVKISSNRFCVLWEEATTENTCLRYAFVDGQGQLEGSIYTAQGVLSDCQPVVANGRIIWYVTNASAPAFCTIDLNNPENATHSCIYTYAFAEYPGNNRTGALYSACAVCGEQGDSVIVPAIQGSDAYTLNKVVDEPGCESTGNGYFTWNDAALYGVPNYGFWGTIPATGHNYVAGVCTACGHELALTVVASGTCGEGLTWTLTDDGTLTISGTGTMDSYSSDSAPWGAYAEEITAVVAKEGVANIGSNAFSYCSNLTDVTLPDSMVSIDNYAFNKCYSLEEVQLPASTTEIGSAAFANCESLRSVNIPYGVTEIQTGTFNGCISLTEITIPGSVKTIGRNAFYRSGLTSVYIPDSVTTISTYAFSECTDLETVRLSQNLTKIDSYAFEQCSSLTEINIPSTVTMIGVDPFRDCASLAGIWVDEANTRYSSDARGVLFDKRQTTLMYAPGAIAGRYIVPDTVRIIDDRAFQCCDQLISVELHANVYSIGDGAFSQCASLKGIWVDANNYSYSSDGYGVLFDKYQQTLLQAPGAISGVYAVPDSVRVIGENAFGYCKKLTEVTLPHNLEQIEQVAFSNCPGITSMVIPQNVSEVGSSAFAGETGMKTLVITSGATKFGMMAFTNAGPEKIIYCGTEEQFWNATGINNGQMLSAPRQYHQWVNGACCYCGQWDPNFVPSVGLSGMTMTLGNSLAANFVIDTAKLDGDDHYAVITKTYADGTQPVSVTIPQSDWKVYSGKLYYFTFTGVNAKEMTDEFTVIVYNAQGRQVSVTYTRTIEDYCYGLITKEEAKAAPDTERLALYTDILNYGAAAQDFFTYNTGNLANQRLTQAQQGYATQSVVTEDVRTQGTGYMGSTLSLKNEILMNFVYRNATINQAAYAVYTFRHHDGGEETVTVPASQFKAYGTSGKYIDVLGMKVADCNQVITVTLYDADGNVLSTSTDSVWSYASRNLSKHEVYRAVLKLADSAYNYFH